MNNIEERLLTINPYSRSGEKQNKIEKIVEEYVYNLGNSAEVGAKYIVQAVQEQIKKAKEQ